MSKSFEPSRLRLLAQGNQVFVNTLPEGFLELFDILRFSNEQGMASGKGLERLGKVAAEFLYSGPESLEKVIALHWSSAHNLFVPIKPDEFSLPGTKERPKKIAEYTNEESAAWTRFMEGLDPSASSIITRETAVMGLCGLRADMDSKIGSAGDYSLSPGESGPVFNRVKAILRGAPFVIAMSVLPDMTSDEASRIFSISQDQYPQLVNEFVEAAQGPIIGIPQ